MKNLLSTAGYNLRVDDTDIPDADGDIHDIAASEIDSYLLLLYTPTLMAGSRWVFRAANVIAAMELCQRRGNPAPIGIANKYERVMADLEAIYQGKKKVPDLPMRKNTAPTMSNVRVILRPHPRTVVEPKRSTGEVGDYRRESDPINTHTNYLDFVI